jgi:magnesium-transporting ATPase (P-type)
MVQMIKTSVKNCMTLSIGDGANDVPMIQKAHVGVGIVGHEGSQAVNSSDFAVGQFQYLEKLLLVHGRNNYRGNAFLLKYFFYKTTILTLTSAIFILLSNTAPAADPWISIVCRPGYNFYTGVTLIIVAWYDQDVDQQLASEYPRLYRPGVKHSFHSSRIIMEWLFLALYHSFVIVIISTFGMQSSSECDFFKTGFVLSLQTVFMSNIGLLMFTNQWYRFVLLLTALQVIAQPIMYALYSGIIMENNLYEGESNYVFDVFSTPTFYFATFLILCVSYLPLMYSIGYKREFSTNFTHLAEEISSYDNDLNLSSVDSYLWNTEINSNFNHNQLNNDSKYAENHTGAAFSIDHETSIHLSEKMNSSIQLIESTEKN